MPSTLSARRRRAGGRALGRIGAALVGLVLLAALIGPVAVLVHERWTPLLRLDERVTRAAEQAVETVPGLLAAARVVTLLGDPTGLTAASAVGALVLLALGHRRLALYLVVVRIGSLLLSTTLKQAVGRARPVFETPVDSAFGLSFPSGHALGSAAMWLAAAVVVLPLVRARRPVLVGALGVALLVAASRVLLGVHFLSDVTAGCVLGAGWTAVCTSLFALWRQEEGSPVEPYEEGLEPELGPATERGREPGR